MKVARGGKKKPFRPAEKAPELPPGWRQEMDKQRRMIEEAFNISCTQVRAVLTRFHAADTLTAVNISDLWLPNLGSQAKHQLALSLLVSTPIQSFVRVRMATYEEFAGFCAALIAVLPDFPSLEDYSPEADWGEVKFLLKGEPVQILYGGPVQRIVDFMEALRVLHGEGSQAMVDLERAIKLQQEFLKMVPRHCADKFEGITPGHIEIPPASFWKLAMSALSQPLQIEQIQSDFLVDLGHASTWNGLDKFGNAIMTGTALPWLAIAIDKNPRIMSLRNATSIVIDRWSAAPPDDHEQVAVRLSEFLERRIQSRSFLRGPLQLRTRNERVPLTISAVLIDDHHHYLVVPIPAEQLAYVGKAIAAVQRILRDAPDWGLQSVGTSDGFQLRDDQGKVPGISAVEVILVVTQVSTAPKIFRTLDVKARLMTLVDACTIFDSIESVNEMSRFWKYVDDLGKLGGSSFSDLGDLFGSFRDAHAQIVEGAITPNFIWLDPHWGASWRFVQLKSYWKWAPSVLPDEASAWAPSELRGVNSLTRVTAKNLPKLAWSAAIGECTVHFILDVDAVDLGAQDGSLLELFIHCAADSIAERETSIASFLKIPFRRINLHCFSATHLLASAGVELTQSAAAMPLITDWKEVSRTDSRTYQARLTVNLAKLAQDLDSAKDARFEADCAQLIVEKLFTTLEMQIPEGLRQALSETAARPPRFTLRHMQRPVDVPDFTRALVPRPEDYKIARRELAILLRAQGVVPGTYTLEAAKALIDPARIRYRDAVHQRIRELDREGILRFCVEQYDALIAAYDREESRIKQSLSHQVDYDREASLSESHEAFIRDSKNYRYFLESAMFLTSPKSTPVRQETVLSILAMIDWLSVLYGASDTLHNGIDVGGLRVDDQYIPEVFYSQTRDEQEETFGREMAALRLGINVAEDDKLTTGLSTLEYMAVLDKAFEDDLQFTYTQFLQVLATLVSWVSVGGATELACGYISDRQGIAERAVSANTGMSMEGALAVIDFLVLPPEQVNRLLGKSVEEGDVPVWEHSKRGYRFTIRPLIELPDRRLLWGAAAAGRTARIWVGSLSAGYLPADFQWPNVRSIVGQLKKELEDGLESRAYEVCARTMPHAIKGIDFKYRFPQQKFPDVGDFDVLAYRPNDNRWLIAECKYNQPAFCLKDTRRLRDRIFGGGSEVGQFRKIERRREFLTKNVDFLRTLLGWPEPSRKVFSLTEVYVSKDLHFWLRFPPYEVPTHFIQIDTLDAWLQTTELNPSS